MKIETIAIVGAGHAGVQLAVSLREEGFAGKVILISGEPDLPYQRPPLSKGFLDGSTDEAELLLRARSFYDEAQIELHTGIRVQAVDRLQRVIHMGNGTSFRYDHLVFATGARDRDLVITGDHIKGVSRLRTIADARHLRGILPYARNAVCIGAGFIGLEFAATAIRMGVQVSVLEAFSRPLSRSASPEVADFLVEHHSRCGVRFHLETTCTEILGSGDRVEAVKTSLGDTLKSDLVVLGIGVIPNDDLARHCGLEVANGIVVDSFLRTADHAISAIGDCASFPGGQLGGLIRIESVQNATDHARHLARQLATGTDSIYQSVPWFWSHQGELRLQMAGLQDGRDVAVVRGEPADNRFSVFSFRDEQFIAVESVNRPTDFMSGKQLLTLDGALTSQEASDPQFDIRRRFTTRV